MGLAENIKQLREQRGLTQKEFGESLDVSAATVSTWEIGTRKPRMGVIEKMSRLYGVKKSDIIEEKETPTQQGERQEKKSEHDEKISMLVDLFEMLPDPDQNQVLFQLLNQVRYLQGLDGKK